jgi:type IV pilus assembly protein PilO
MAGINDLAKKGPAFHAALLACATVVLGLLYWQFFYSAVADDLQQQRGRNAQLQQTNADLKKQKETWEELALQKDRLDEQSKKNRVSLPASAELPAFFGHMQKQMAASGVQLKSWKREKEVPIESYVRVPVKIELTGTFYQLNNYFYLLYQTDRIVTVENLSISTPRRNGSEMILSAAFTASTFRQADGAEPLMEEEEEPKGAKDAVKGVNEKSAKGVEKQTGEAPGGADAKDGKNPDSAQKGVDRMKNP